MWNCEGCDREATHRNASGHSLCDVCAFSFACRVTPVLVGLVLTWGAGPTGGDQATIAREVADVRRFA